MVDPKVIEAVNLFRTTLESEGIRIHNMILFGSSSTGSLRPGGDIDIAIISDNFEGKDIFTRARMTKDAELNTIRKFRLALDIITLTTDEYNNQNSVFFRNIRKGVPVRAFFFSAHEPCGDQPVLSTAGGSPRSRHRIDAFNKTWRTSEREYHDREYNHTALDMGLLCAADFFTGISGRNGLP